MFQLVDCFFFISLGITFLLLFLMAFHFKTRISTLEKKNNALAEMCTTIVTKISQVKQMVVEQNTMMKPVAVSNNILPNIFIRSPPSESSKVIEISDEIESESESDEESESESDEEIDDQNKMEKKEDQEDIPEDIQEVQEEDIKVEEIEIEIEEPIHLETINMELELPDTDLQSEVFSVAINNHDDKNAFKKMSVQMLKTLVISKGLCTDPSKMKKLDLLKMLESETTNKSVDEK